jgi:hypothetical protein
MSSEQGYAENATSAEDLRKATSNERYGRAAMFAAGLCVLGVLVVMVYQLGWWAMLFGPAYLAGTGVALLATGGRTGALTAVALSTGSIAIVVALVKLTGLA